MPRYAAGLKVIRSALYSLPCILVLFISVPAQAVEVLTDRMDLDCSQGESFVLACSYRPLMAQTVTSITPRLMGDELGLSTRVDYPATDSITAILILVDTSDPGRQDVLNINTSQIQQMLDKTRPHQRFGLATFDKELILRAPIGSPVSAVASAAAGLEASGLTTELYRNTIKAIEILGESNADRRLLVLFSDGQAEDKAYFHDDVINVARRHGVIINSLGFPRSTALSVALQTVRRLSEETGGRYVESDNSYALAADFLAAPFANADRGGHFILDLAETGRTARDSVALDLRFNTNSAAITVRLPVFLPAPPPPQPLPAATTPPAPAVQTVIQARDPGYAELLLWYGVPIALVILIMLTLLTLFTLSRRHKPQVPASRISYADIKPLAYLITQDEKGENYPVTSATWRIGRSMDNEMTIDDNSISRRHAEIQRETNGQFVVYDRGSTNGVYVNNRKVSRHLLTEGDIIEIGDVFLRFTQNPADYQYADDTAMMNTRAPDLP